MFLGQFSIHYVYVQYMIHMYIPISLKGITGVLQYTLTKFDPSHVVNLRTEVQAAKDVNNSKGSPESKCVVNLEEQMDYLKEIKEMESLEMLI